MLEEPKIDSHNADLPEDEDTLVRHSQENPAAFGPIFDYYAPRVYRYALHRIGNASDAEDVTSRTFTDALQGLDRYRPKRQGSFGGWLFTIARRRCADYFRVSNPLPLSNFNLKDNAAGPLDEVISRDEQRRLEGTSPAPICRRTDLPTIRRCHREERGSCQNEPCPTHKEDEGYVGGKR